ncbi:MAG TPA: DinB family protein [Vicinamibacterales bacterium]|nr:DinB family protein [Vicinamibacterales bacterium]
MPVRRPLDVEQELVETFEQCGRATEHLVSVVPRRVWDLPSPTGHGRTIAAIFTHMHGLRKMIAKMGGARVGPSLDRKTVTPEQVRRALREINDTLTTMFRESLGRGEARVKGISRRSVNIMMYLVQHDAHHRGQITWLARDLGHKFNTIDTMKIWGWKKLD